MAGEMFLLAGGGKSNDKTRAKSKDEIQGFFAALRMTS
jgi:hypothetical protein